MFLRLPYAYNKDEAENVLRHCNPPYIYSPQYHFPTTGASTVELVKEQ